MLIQCQSNLIFNLEIERIEEKKDKELINLIQ